MVVWYVATDRHPPVASSPPHQQEELLHIHYKYISILHYKYISISKQFNNK